MVLNYRSGSIDGGKSESIHAGCSKVWKRGAHGSLAWIVATRRLRVNTKAYKRAKVAGKLGSFVLHWKSHNQYVGVGFLKLAVAFPDLTYNTRF